MSRIGKLNGIENPEQKPFSKEFEETPIPSDVERKKLERPVKGDQLKSFNNDGRKKLSGIKHLDRHLEKKRPESIESTINDYFSDLKKRSDCSSSIKGKSFETSDLKKLSPEEIAFRRDEFDDNKQDLKKQWEVKHGRLWPKYEDDVYSSNGKQIRKAGRDYDAHHIQPLGMNGKNEVSNITPLHANEHYDRQGIHAPDSPYSRLDKMLRG